MKKNKKLWNNFKKEVTDDRVEIPIREFFKDRLDEIKYKEGYSNRDIYSRGYTTGVYTVILFKLLELIVLDVIEGMIVIFNKKRDAKFYVDYHPASTDMILGKTEKKDNSVPKVDFKKSKYRIPFIAFDSGYKGSNAGKVIIPNYLYAYLVDKVNSGFKYSSGTKRNVMNILYGPKED